MAYDRHTETHRDRWMDAQTDGQTATAYTTLA